MILKRFVFTTCFLIMILFSGSAFSGEFDNLDQYFEDYFEEDANTSEDDEFLNLIGETSPEENVTDTKTSVEESDINLSQDDEGLFQEDSNVKQSPVKNNNSPLNSEKNTDLVSQGISSLRLDNTIQSELKSDSLENLKEVNESYLPEEVEEIEVQLIPENTNTYLQVMDEELAAFQQIIDDMKDLRQSSTRKKIKDFLIGEEIDPDILEIELNPYKEELSAKNGQPKTLKQCIAESTEEHLPIDIAKEKVLLYRKQMNKAFRDMFPSATVSWANQKRGLGNSPDATTLTHDAKVSFRQPLYQGGALWNKLKEEYANLNSAMGEYNKIFSDLALEVATAYFNLARTKTLLTHREALLAKANESLNLSQEKFNASLISEIEHLNVQSQQSQLNSSLQQAREDIELAMLEMQKSMNEDLNVPINVMILDDYFKSVGGLKLIRDDEAEELKETEEEQQVADTKVIDDLIRKAYENRPEFVIGENKVRSKRYAEKVGKADWLPKASIFAEFGRNREVLATVTDIADGRWEDEFRFGLDFSWNLWGSTVRNVYDYNDQAPRKSGFSSGGKGDYTRSNTVSVGILDGLETFARVKEAEIATKEAILEFELSEKDMVSEVKESYYNFNRAKIQMKSVLKKIRYREKLVELASHRSEINEIQISEYLQAEIDLVEEKATFYQAMVDFFIAKASLSKAVGITNFLDVDINPLEKIKNH